VKKKTLKKLIKGIDSKDPKVIVATLMGNDDVSHTDMGAINTIMQDMGLVSNPAKVMGAIRKELSKKMLKGLKSWEDVKTMVTVLSEKHDLEDSKILSTIRKAVGREDGLTMPRRPTLGETKQAIVDYVTSDKAPTPAGLKTYLVDNITFDADKDTNLEKAGKVVSMNFSFAMAIVNGCK